MSTLMLLFVLMLLSLTNGQNLASFPSPTRTNYCDRSLLVANGSIKLSQALKGMHVNVGTRIGLPNYMNIPNASNPHAQPTSGLAFDLLTQLSVIGGFSINYTLLPPLGKGKDDIYLQYATETTDIFVSGWNSDTQKRRIANLGFTVPIADASIYMVTTTSTGLKNPSMIDLFAFLGIFSPNLWITIVLLLIFNALTHWIMDSESSLPRCMYLSFGSFTATESMAPLKVQGAILNIGLSFFVLIIAATYTANLASSFINNTPQILALSSMEEANRQQSKVCASTGQTTATLLANYPSVVPVLLTPPSNWQSAPGYVLYELSQGKCDAALVAMTDWEFNRGNTTVNPKCNLALAGSPVSVINGAWIYRMIDTKYCSRLVAEVFNQVLINWTATGYYQNLYDTAVQISIFNAKHCAEVQASAESSALTLSDVGGIFVIYGIFWLVAVVRGIYEILIKYRNSKDLKKSRYFKFIIDSVESFMHNSGKEYIDGVISEAVSCVVRGIVWKQEWDDFLAVEVYKKAVDPHVRKFNNVSLVLHEVQAAKAARSSATADMVDLTEETVAFRITPEACKDRYLKLIFEGKCVKCQLLEDWDPFLKRKTFDPSKRWCVCISGPKWDAAMDKFLLDSVDSILDEKDFIEIADSVKTQVFFSCCLQTAVDPAAAEKARREESHQNGKTWEDHVNSVKYHAAASEAGGQETSSPPSASIGFSFAAAAGVNYTAKWFETVKDEDWTFSCLDRWNIIKDEPNRNLLKNWKGQFATTISIASFGSTVRQGGRKGRAHRKRLDILEEAGTQDQDQDCS